jgi:hypothetical protein
VHREIFPITRVGDDRSRLCEYETVVKPAIERWESFVREVLGDVGGL